MKFKIYQTLQTKNYLKNKSFIFISNGVNRKAINWLKFEQNLKTINLNYYKIYNKIGKKIFKASTYTNFINLINGPFFFLSVNNNKIIPKKLLKKDLLELLKFIILALKLNNKIYSLKQIKKLNSFIYKKEITTFYQFLITNLKFSQTLIK